MNITLPNLSVTDVVDFIKKHFTFVNALPEEKGKCLKVDFENLVVDENIRVELNFDSKLELPKIQKTNLVLIDCELNESVQEDLFESKKTPKEVEIEEIVFGEQDITSIPYINFISKAS